MKGALLGIDPNTKTATMCAVNDEENAVEMWRQGLIVVPVDIVDARVRAFEVVNDIYALARGES